MKSALYAGSFDPLTNGHLWVIETASEMFDHLYVAVGNNKSKKYLLSQQERFDLVESTVGVSQNRTSITTKMLDNKYLVDFARELNVQYLIRGVRNIQDFEFEKILQNVNSEINPDVTTILLCPPKHLSEISSSAVKSLCGPDNWLHVVEKMVPKVVLSKLWNMDQNGELK